MSESFDEGQVHAWLSNLYGGTSGLINIVSTSNWAGRCFDDIDAATRYVAQLDKAAPQGIYARVTTLNQVPEKYSRGDVDHTKEFVGFWADLDIQGPGHKTTQLLPATMEDCLAIIDATGLPEPTEWIHSGGGMYPWWLLNEPSDLGPYGHQSQEYVELAANWQRVIELASQKLGYHYGAGVGDLTRVLRIPGTINRKVAEDPRRCEWRTDLSSSRPHDLGDLIDAMDTAMKRLEVKQVAAPQLSPKPASQYTGGERVGDAFNAATTWPQLLLADGASIFKDRGMGYVEWTRPGKDRRHGLSGTTGFKGSDVLKVHSDMWTPLVQGKTYDRYGYYVATKFNGDFTAATRQLAAEGFGTPGTRVTDPNHWTSWETGGSNVQECDFSGETGFTESDKPTDAELVERLEQKLAEKKAPVTAKPTYTFTDSGIADRMELRYGNEWRYCGARQRFGWLHWNGKVWETDRKGAVTNLIDQMVKEEYAKTHEEEDEKKRDALRRAIKPMLANSKQLGATASFARRWRIAIEPDELDFHRSKITCDNGVLDLDDMSFGDQTPPSWPRRSSASPMTPTRRR